MLSGTRNGLLTGLRRGAIAGLTIGLITSTSFPEQSQQVNTVADDSVAAIAPTLVMGSSGGAAVSSASAPATTSTVIPASTALAATASSSAGVAAPSVVLGSSALAVTTSESAQAIASTLVEGSTESVSAVTSSSGEVVASTLVVGSSALATATGNSAGAISSTLMLGSESSTYQAESNALFARFDQTYTTTEKDAKDALIATLKANGLWSTIDVLRIVAGSKSTNDATRNWKQDAYNATINGSLTYITGRCFTGFSTSNYLSDGFVPSSAGGNFAQNSATIGIYSTGDGQGAVFAMGAINSGSTIYTRIQLRDSSNSMAAIMNSGASSTSSATNSVLTAVGLSTATRTTASGSGAVAIYKNASQLTTNTTASVGNQSVQLFTGNQNNNGTPATADTNLALVAEVKASGWTSTQVSNFYSALNTYLQTLKVNTYTLTYSSDGDTNGVFYLLGTNTGMTAWANPAYTASNPGSETSYSNNAHILLSASGYASGTIGTLTDRTTGTFQTNNANGCWVKADIGGFRALSCDKYSLRHINSSGSYIRSWKLQGSNDDSSWTDLDIRTSDTTINASSAWGTFTCNQGVSTAFRWFRILVTNFNSTGTAYDIRLGEWGLYGELTISSPTTFTYSGLPGDQAGIIYYLACTASELNWANGWVNPHASGVITISASAVGSGNVSLLCDRVQGFFQTTNVSNSFVQFDFGASRTVRVDSYLIRNANVSSNLLRNWSLQGSNNGSSWTDLDIRTSDTTITTTNQFYHLTCNQGSTSYWRYIRLLQTNTNSSGANSLTVGDIEFYGAIA